MLEGLAARDARVEVLDGGGRGLVAALNLALSQATSPYVARMDADDEALPQRLEASVAALEADAGLGGVGTGVELFREDQPVSPSMRDYAEWLNGPPPPSGSTASASWKSHLPPLGVPAAGGGGGRRVGARRLPGGL